METVYYSATKIGHEREVLRIEGNESADFRPDIDKHWGMGVEDCQAVPFARALLADVVGEALAEKYAERFAQGILCFVKPDHFMTSSRIIADWVARAEGETRL